MSKTYVVKLFFVPVRKKMGIPQGYKKASDIWFNSLRIGSIVVVWGVEKYDFVYELEDDV